MKKTILLGMLMPSSISFAQLKQVDFDAARLLLQGNNSDKALTNLESLEKKFPNDAQVLLIFKKKKQNA